MTKTVAADYLVIGAGASAMAFVDALIDHADVSVVMIDRRHSAGGHWLDDYPFVRLHQASAFYGVASTPLGGGRIQAVGPEAGLHERASAAEICLYYARLLDRFSQTGKVTFHPSTEYLGEGRFSSRLTSDRYQVREGCRIVDARYLSPDIPSCTAPPFAVNDARVIPVNDLVRVDDAPSQFVITGSGKTATDACVWLLSSGVDPNRICWVRPRDPWMLNRAVVQPDPAVFIGMGADVLELAAAASNADELFLRMEDAGIMMRIDTSVTPTMAKAPTLAKWELDALRSIENVVRKGHIRSVSSGRIELTRGELPIAKDAVVVHCAASGLKYLPLTPIWDRSTITLQPVRAGFPCFGAALIGYVEATRDSDEEKNRVCPSSPYPNTPADWAGMQVLGGRAAAAFSREPDIHEWAQRTALNPARIPKERAADADVARALSRYREHMQAGFSKLDELSRTPT
jgi:hypothetical protein